MRTPEELRERITAFENSSTLHLRNDNRWVRLAELIPWHELDALYADGERDTYRPLLVACFLQAHYGYSDEETVQQVRESPYLQYLCGMEGYRVDGLPFDMAQLQAFRLTLSEETLLHINALIRR